MENNKLRIFLLGGICFIVSQPLLRVPILVFLQNNTRFSLYYNLYPVLIGVLIAFSAGVFEEGFRFIFKSLFFKASKPNILVPIIFGFGHGITEAVMILGPALQTLPIQSLILPIFERVLAIILHMGLTVIVWNGFLLNKKIKYLIIAILIHGLVNSLIPILSSFDNWILIFEITFTLIDIFMVRYIYTSRKLYDLEEARL